MKRSILLVTLSLLAGAPRAHALECRLLNPTKRALRDALVRLPVPAPGPSGTFVVTRAGAEVPYQVEEVEGMRRVWILADFEPESEVVFCLAAGQPAPPKARVTVKDEGATCAMDNGLVAVRLPAAAPSGGQIPGPIAGLRLGDRWVAASAWRTEFVLRKFEAVAAARGPLFARVRLRYDFAGTGGEDGSTAAFAEISVTVGPGWSHAEIAEKYAMAPDDQWELDLSSGWRPNRGISRPFGAGAGSGLMGGKASPERPLEPGGLPYQRPDLFINLFPRWNQHYKDGWAFAATDGTVTDGTLAAGAVVVSAGRWTWPHESSLRAVVRERGQAILECPTWKGRRLWWLFGPAAAPISTDYVARHAWEDLDRLNHEFILTWPGRKGAFSGMDYYDGGQMNPTGGLRRLGRAAIADAGKPGDLSTLTRVQVMFHPDAYGSLEDFWSPENPNFFTDFMRVPIAMTARLKDHPRFEDFRREAEAALRSDVDHSVTLPGGAGQECPGYLAYALSHWEEIAPLCREHLGFDPLLWPRVQAARRFLRRISQPDGEVRRMLPIGDTHPGKDGSGPAVVQVPADEVRAFATEELPGFGVVFSNNPGTPRETYLAFKAGPNRGHYHGDQLAFHYCAAARALAVDHHSSYSPRAGQEHMHNRVAFHTEELPYANMDGYERLIAFKASAEADVAVGQVESDRLREVQKLPPEIWHQEYPQHVLKSPLAYRRTVVLVKGGPQDYVVLRDEFRAPEPLAATFCLHVRSDVMRRPANDNGRSVDFGGKLTLHCVWPEAFEFEEFPWSHDNGGRESTHGARLTVRGERGEFITVLYPGAAPAIGATQHGVKLGEEEITFGGNLSSAGDGTASVVTVKRGGREVLRLAGSDIDLGRAQGKIGLFVPDAGYPFGRIPDWLVRQRARPAGER
jgi:hypothetical protein